MAVEYISLAQTDETDSEMIDHIHYMIGENWELFNIGKKKCKIWTFQRETE